MTRMTSKLRRDLPACWLAAPSAIAARRKLRPCQQSDEGQGLDSDGVEESCCHGLRTTQPSGRLASHVPLGLDARLMDRYCRLRRGAFCVGCREGGEACERPVG
ncbi:hypothetical protein BD309DRAFT_967619 [Dichomitus squalens]|nr:hypothetical protein BD309DRAFT_967619 [Dichomitus squalens]